MARANLKAVSTGGDNGSGGVELPEEINQRFLKLEQNLSALWTENEQLKNHQQGIRSCQDFQNIQVFFNCCLFSNVEE